MLVKASLWGDHVCRVLGMVDGCLLVVDANEGALSQTKFVLGKALRSNLRPLVIMNKVHAEPALSNNMPSKLNYALNDRNRTLLE